MHRESISAKNFIGLKLQMFSPANFSTFTIYIIPQFLIYDKNWRIKLLKLSKKPPTTHKLESSKFSGYIV